MVAGARRVVTTKLPGSVLGMLRTLLLRPPRKNHFPRTLSSALDTLDEKAPLPEFCVSAMGAAGGLTHEISEEETTASEEETMPGIEVSHGASMCWPKKFS